MMEDKLVQRVHAAAISAWWTVLIGMVWMTVAWFAFLGIVTHRPEWVLSLWGGHDVTWAMVQNISLWLIGVFKLVLWIMALIALWLTLWYRALRREKD
jgi:hypothetical protein